MPLFTTFWLTQLTQSQSTPVQNQREATSKKFDTCNVHISQKPTEILRGIYLLELKVLNHKSP